ncbi:TetR/AcrR family transcriptional regulator [Kutzneria sp. NPDC052558]|uniref:TetR/AcrR family transcriptional regulator n=1 Tax=Kutzneria sp. NPDC052558 TaxID=3364121 RepID=UPI0037C890BF
MDHRKGPRRRGDELNQAIFAAALDELTEVGYPRLTMERIAERARTSKASLYRRWAGRAELVMDAVMHQLPTVDDLPDTGELRGDLLTALRAMAVTLNSPVGTATRGMIAEISGDSDTVRQQRERFIERRNQLMVGIVRRAVARGEARAGALSPLVASVGPALIRDHFLSSGGPIPDSVIVDVVDHVVVPLIKAV